MPYTCDHCGETLEVDVNGFFVGPDGTSDCAAWRSGHHWEGRSGL